MRYPLTPMAILMVAAPLLGQVTPVPRRIPKGFQGELPLVWRVEGMGRLSKATLRLLKDSGQEVAAWSDLAAVQIGQGEWQVWTWVKPSEILTNAELGSQVLEAKLEWVRDGRSYTERVESAWRVDDSGEGWLQRAYLEEDGPWKLSAGTRWASGNSLALSLGGTTKIKGMKYQVVRDEDERVLQSWTSLSRQQGRTWKLEAGRGWPSGPAHVWVVVEGLGGQIQAMSREVWIGALPKGGVLPAIGGGKQKSGMIQPSVQVGAQSLLAASAWPTTDWLAALSPDNPDGVDWSLTNRIATVTVGYRDEERNEARLWPSEAGRPMSLTLTGANKLGKPLYSVSYLLGDRAYGATRLEDYADQAVLTAGTTGLPQGADKLEVGGQTAPVIFSPGTVEDAFGKTLAMGYGWAAYSLDASNKATLTSAKAWTSQPNPQPVVGVEAIRQAATLRQSLISERILSVGGDPGASEARMDPAITQPYAFSLSAQDPSGRVMVSKGLGAPMAVNQPTLVTVAGNDLTSGLLDFNSPSAALPSWLTLNGQGRVAVAQSGTPSAGNNVELLPPWASTMEDYYYDENNVKVSLGFYTETVEAGTLAVQLGTVPVGSTKLEVSANTTGPVRAQWQVNGTSVVFLDGGVYSGSGARILTFPFGNATLPVAPYSVTLRLSNDGPIQAADPTGDPNAPKATVDDLQVNRTDGLVLLKIADAELQKALVPGYTHTQFGSVSIMNQGTCTVVMVTDQDGASVAEIKDPEGRTIYKIVNPTSTTYSTLFKDYKGGPLYFSDMVRRAAIPVDQQNLVTQYGFDREGHLRIVLPPLGFKTSLGRAGADPIWGVRLDEAMADPVLGLANTDPDPTTDIKTLVVNKTSNLRLPYATYNAYDASGHIVATYNPDEGLTKFIVDQKGRVHFSQTEGQRASDRAVWTRTVYDGALRVAAVGEVADVSVTTSEVAGVDAAQLDATYNTLTSGTYRSRNFYDQYRERDTDTEWNPKTSVVLPVALRTLLPDTVLWQAFPEGHLTETRDERTTERYFYDQDGRIVIRWVQLKQSDGAYRHFAIGIYYDFAGRVKRLVYPSGPGGDPLQVVYTYDELGRLFAVGTPQDKAYFARYAYQPTGEVRAIIYGPGEGFVAKRMLQDPQGWLRQLSIQSK